ncbi:MAG: sensor histidine kinase [Bacteroidales bacterium]|nr:sensor histidine kinase [Bacteroidales bacterium]
MKWWLFTLVIFSNILSIDGYAKVASPVRDSLLNLLNTSKGEKKVDVLNDICWSYVFTDTRKARDYGNAALSMAITINYTRGKSIANNRIGVTYDILSKYDSALIYYHKALVFSKETNDPKLIASNLSNIGLAHWHIGNNNDALKYFFSSLSYFESAKNLNGLASAYNNIGLIYQSLRNSYKAIQFFDSSYVLYKKFNDEFGIGAVFTNIGSLYLSNKNNVKAYEYLIKSVKIKEKNKDYYGLSISYNYLGSLFIEKMDYDKALDYEQKSIDYAKIIGDDNEFASALLKIAVIYIKKNNAAKAMELNILAEQLAKKTESQKLLYKTYQNFSDIYLLKGNVSKAFEYYRKYKETEDSVVNSQRFNQIYDLELKHETEKSATEIALLNRQKKIQTLQIEKQKLVISKRNNQIILVITCFFITLLILYIIYLNYRHKQQIKLDEAIYNVREKRANEVIEAEIKERKRIGEELHDGLGQILSLLKLTLTSLENKQTLFSDKQKELIGNAVELTDNAFSELRNISHNMAPLFLKEKGLTNSIKDLLDGLNQSNKYKVSMDITGFNNQLENFLELTIYRVVQEALNNIIIHAEATEINFQLLQSDKEITMMIEDNGKGFDIGELENKHGIGLRNIRSRVENIGGKLHLDSVISRGTIVTIIIPIKNLKNEY